MEFGQSQNAPAQFVIAKERREILPNRGNQSVVNRHGDIVAEERRFERRRIISGARPKNVGLDRVGEGGRESELVILEFLVELMEGPSAQRVISLDQKRAKGTLRERFFFPLLVG